MSDTETAQMALVKATAALTKIESHEAVCAARWGSVRTFMILLAIKMIGVIGLLTWQVAMR
jgi:hypothetical protein